MLTKLLYRVFALCFWVGKRLPLKEKSVALLAVHNEGENGALSAIANEAEKRGYEPLWISPRTSGVLAKIFFLLYSPFKLARAKYVFLNDNFMPMAYLHFRPETTVTQLWHGDGAFKKFGLMIDVAAEYRRIEEAGNKELDFVVCSSKQVQKIYAKAFGVGLNQVLPLGSARTDYFFTNIDKLLLRQNFDMQYPQCKGKKLLLYAPTFRDGENENIIQQQFDAQTLQEALGDEWAVLYRFHPAFSAQGENIKGTINVSHYKSINELVLLADKLITDYSSIAMDFALLNKPVYFYAFDLEAYQNTRDFYFDYETYVPGPIAKNMTQLIEAILQSAYPFEKLESFKKFNYDFEDDNNAGRILDFILTKQY